MPADLTNEDKATIATLLRESIAADRFPLSPWIKRLKAILAKLDPPSSGTEWLPSPMVYPPPKPPGERSMALGKKRRG
jgi:hypothetical protein